MDLTPKQEAFTQAILGGHSKTQAYRMSYSCDDMNPFTVNHEAHLLSLNPKIATRIDALKEAVSTELVARQIETAENLAHDARINLNGARMDGAWAPANKAIELIARLTGNLEGPERTTEVRITKVTVVLPPSGPTGPVIDVAEYTVVSGTEGEIEGS